MDQITTDLDQFRLASLAWGPTADASAPLAVLLHGFPDTAHTWRHLGPALAEAGYRVVAPFTRGYGPSGIPADGSYHVPALMSDVLELQAALSWYTLFNQLPALPERNFDKLVAHLWRRWSPGYDATTDLAHLAASLPTTERKAAALGYYRAQPRQWQLPSRYRRFAEAWVGSPRVPLLYLQGADDGCLDARWATRVSGRLGPGGRAAVITDAGHFLQLERPDVVNARVLEYLAEEAP
ncbi:alpha/beta fold hydrolase [Nocardioides pelophilus]|uniref:alpha/beta fold hydrolase n=1 Tax=Nocardioides pelophilus TaxID=2172019 RepID=UPI0016014C85|nr:alpha/beta hydrolase [Nocardioides pelophilus]